MYNRRVSFAEKDGISDHPDDLSCCDFVSLFFVRHFITAAANFGCSAERCKDTG